MPSSTLSPQEIRLNRLEKIKNYIETFNGNNNGVLPSGMQWMLNYIDHGVTPTPSNTLGYIIWVRATPTDKLNRVHEIALRKQGNEFVYKCKLPLFTQRRSPAVRSAYIHICHLARGTEPIEMAVIAPSPKSLAER